jgi:site-specific DNA-methyltransferase (adenine-specific)
MNGPWNSEEEANNVCSYIGTKFFHFMIGLKKITQHTTSKVYEFVPMQDFSKKWTDAELYKKYELTPEEIDYIESSVWTEKEVTADGN